MSYEEASRIPAELRPFASPILMMGESMEEYKALRDLLIMDVCPRSNIEWLWLFDLAELSWEILRYRRLKVRALELFRARAIESLLFRLDGGGAYGDSQRVRQFTKRNVIEWQNDLNAASEIESRLEQAGFDLLAINAEIYVQAREVVAMFEGLIHRAQHRRNLVVKEMRVKRLTNPIMHEPKLPGTSEMPRRASVRRHSTEAQSQGPDLL